MRVSVVMPVFNEEKYISKVLHGIIEQDWNDELEILVVDGGSTDNTVSEVTQIASKAPANRNIRLLYNSRRHIPVALNIGCRAATGDVIVRLDGHTYPPPDYVRIMVKALSLIQFRGVIGGRCMIVPSNDSPMAKAIACAVAHPFGIGNASYRTMNWDDRNQPFMIERDTVPFGAFSKQLWFQLNGYDERMLSSEDYDFNYRARKNGYGIWLIPSVALQYVARGTLGQLWRQYFRYGYWTVRFLVNHRHIPALRKIAPFVFVSFFLILGCFSLLWVVELFAVYLAVSTVFAVQAVKRANLPWVQWWRLVVCFVVLHWSYGIGNVVSLFGILVSKSK